MRFWWIKYAIAVLLLIVAITSGLHFDWLHQVDAERSIVQASLGGSADDSFLKVRQSSTGTLVVLGQTDSVDEPFVNRTSSYFIAINSSQAQLKKIVYIPLDEATDLELLADDRILVAGSTLLKGQPTATILNYSANGQLQQTLYGDDAVSGRFQAISVTSDGGFIATGTTSNTSVIVKYSAQANVQWSKTMSRTNGDGFIAATEKSDHTIAVLEKYNFSTKQGYYIELLDADGTTQRHVFVHRRLQEQPTNIVHSGDNGLYIGFTYSVYHLNKQNTVHRITSFTKNYETITNIQPYLDNQVFIGGQRSSNGMVDLVQTDTGKVTASFTFGGERTDLFRDVTVLTNGGFVAVGERSSDEGDFTQVTNGLTDGFLVIHAPIHVTRLSLSKSILTLTEGHQAHLQVAIRPTTAYNKQVYFATSDATVATVNDAGVVYAKQPGQALITVTAADNGHTAVATINVVGQQQPAASVTAEQQAQQDQVEQVTFAQTHYIFHSKENVSLHQFIIAIKGQLSDYVWVSSDTSIVKINPDGNVQPLQAGQATIIVQNGTGRELARIEIEVPQQLFQSLPTTLNSQLLQQPDQLKQATDFFAVLYDHLVRWSLIALLFLSMLIIVTVVVWLRIKKANER